MKKALLVGSLCWSLAVAVQAAPITGLFSTGVDDAGAQLPGASIDTHYQVFSGIGSGVSPFVLAAPRPNYVPNSATSAWIWENADGSPSSVRRTYRLTFDLAGFDPDSATIQGTWAVDDVGLDILLNGVSSGQTVGGFDTLKSFSLHSGFVAGVNTIDFVVENFGSVGGFRVGSLVGDAAALPAPATGVLVLLGLAGFAARWPAWRRFDAGVR